MTGRILLLFLALAPGWLAAGSILDVFPAGGPPNGDGSTACTTAFRPSGSTWAPGLDERSVFHARLEHKGTPPWRLGVGKGGQIYSLVGPFGESVPPQAHQGAPWIDEVWQIVSVSHAVHNPDRFPGRHAPAAYYIHQAGTYMRDAVRQTPFYSPLLGSEYDPDRRALRVVNWGQHAHVPTLHRSGLLYYSQFRDVGEGVVEITYVIHNFGKDTLDYFNTPWGGVRRSILPVHLLAEPDGTVQRIGGSFGSSHGPPTLRNVGDTGGWAVFAQDGDAPDRPALGVVFGRDRHLAEKPPWQRQATRWRWGVAGLENRTNPRDYLVAVINPICTVGPGETFFYRLYFVVGPLSAVNRRARGLVRHVDYGMLAFPRKGEPTFEARGRRLWARPVQGSSPLFLLRDTRTGKDVVTSDPYALASTAPYDNPYPEGHPKHARYANREVLRPYDGRTEFVALLGYALPEEKER